MQESKLDKAHKDLLQMKQNREKTGKEPPDLDKRLKDANAVRCVQTRRARAYARALSAFLPPSLSISKGPMLAVDRLPRACCVPAVARGMRCRGACDWTGLAQKALNVCVCVCVCVGNGHGAGLARKRWS